MEEPPPPTTVIEASRLLDSFESEEVRHALGALATCLKSSVIPEEIREKAEDALVTINYFSSTLGDQLTQRIKQANPHKVKPREALIQVQRSLFPYDAIESLTEARDGLCMHLIEAYPDMNLHVPDPQRGSTATLEFTPQIPANSKPIVRAIEHIDTLLSSIDKHLRPQFDVSPDAAGRD